MTLPGLLPVPAAGEERESTFPYWLWAPLPAGGVTLKNLEEEGGVRWAWPGGARDTLRMQARPSEIRRWSQHSLQGGLWGRSKAVFPGGVALELGLGGGQHSGRRDNGSLRRANSKRSIQWKRRSGILGGGGTRPHSYLLVGSVIRFLFLLRVRAGGSSWE